MKQTISLSVIIILTIVSWLTYRSTRMDLTSLDRVTHIRLVIAEKNYQQAYAVFHGTGEHDSDQNAWYDASLLGIGQ